MPLSEQEQRLLDEMERHLMRNDADVVSAPTDGRTLSYRNIVYGTILVLVGLGALIVGVSTQLIVVGVIGFVVMLASAYFTLVSWKGQSRAAFQEEQSPGSDEPGLRVVQGGKGRRSKATKAPKTAKRGTMMERFEERWRRRRDQNGY